MQVQYICYVDQLFKFFSGDQHLQDVFAWLCEALCEFICPFFTKNSCREYVDDLTDFLWKVKKLI